MKCPVCASGEMKLRRDSIEQDGVEFDAWQCSHCGEELLTMKQLQMLARQYRQLRKAKAITFAKWGNSIAVRIPNDIAAEFKITEGKRGVLTKDKKGIVIIPSV
ncbi:MAG TPA: hypothetical protein VJC16_00485 [Candidatus Nanoarchaeia archaeon]|nr:hypothetical protein [Candidatus Nanoarchaeia archaeon]